MKSKLITFSIIIFVVLSIFVIPAFAEIHVVDITRPEGDEVVTKDTFSIFGTCVYDETTIKLEYLDTDTGDYKPLRTTDGVSTFKVGSGKMFGKDIKLKKGPNDIRIIAYTNTKESKDEPETFYYTITFGEEKNSGDWFNEAMDWITNPDGEKK
jgi:hypothetical protein